MPACGAGTFMMTLLRNQSTPFSLASLLTAVGLRRVSIGPPIRIIVLGRSRILLGIHQRYGGHHRNRGLAHRHDAGTRPEVAQEVDDIVDVVVEIEGAMA